MALTTDTPAGSDSNSGTSAAPWATFAHAFGVMTGGQSLFVKAGTYTQNILGNSVPNGTNFSGGETKIVGAGIGQTIIKPSGAACIYFDQAKSNMEFSDLELESPSHYGIYITVADNLRFNNIYVHHCNSQNIFIYNDADSIELINVESSFSGAPGGTPNCSSGTGICHGIYAEGTNILVEKCKLHDNNGNGIQWYPGPTNGTMKNCLVYDNGYFEGPPDQGSGIIIQGTNIDILNCTIFNNEYIGIWVVAGSTGVDLKNCIVYSNNVFADIYDPGSVANQVTNRTDNPSFVNEGTHDLHLQSGSTSRNSGTNIAPAVTDDYDGNARPLGAGWDVGAYEYVE